MSKMKYHNIKVSLTEEDLYMLDRGGKIFNWTYLTEEDEVKVNIKLKKCDTEEKGDK